MIDVELKQNITYILGQERSEGNLYPVSPIFISRALNVPIEEVEEYMKEMGL